MVVEQNMIEAPGKAIHRSNWQDYEYPSTAVVEAVATALGRDICDLAPLQSHVDGDTLDTLLNDNGAPVRVTFEYAGTLVSVESTGSITVQTE